MTLSAVSSADRRLGLSSPTYEPLYHNLVLLRFLGRENVLKCCFKALAGANRQSSHISNITPTVTFSRKFGN